MCISWDIEGVFVIRHNERSGFISELIVKILIEECNHTAYLAFLETETKFQFVANRRLEIDIARVFNYSCSLYGVTAESFVADSTNYHSAPGSTKDVLCVPCEYVLDAIDIQRYGSTQIVKVFQPAQDAGYTFVTGADETAPDYEVSFDSWESPFYCGKSLRRKCIKVTESGRAYFKDTNNSTADFILGGQRAVVRRSFTAPDAE